MEQDGIVVVPFLSSEETKDLERFYHDHPLNLGLPYHSTVLSKNIDYRRSVHEQIRSTFSAALERTFTPEYRFLFGCYTIKEQGAGSEWAVHQDWSFADESQHRSVGVWCPMVDVDTQNGCLGVVKGSHDFIPNIRGTKTISEYSGISELIRDKYLDFVPMKAGEAAIFYNSLIHYSPPNVIGPTRITANCVMVPEVAQPLHYFRDPSWPENEVEVFEIDSEFLLQNDYTSQGRPVQGKSRGKIDHPVRPLDKREFEALVRKHQPLGHRLRRVVRNLISV